MTYLVFTSTIFAQHTLVSPSAFSRRAVVSYWRKYVHEVLVNRLGGLSLPRKSVVRLTDRPNMTLDVYRGRKTTMQQWFCSNANISRKHECIWSDSSTVVPEWNHFIFMQMDSPRWPPEIVTRNSISMKMTISQEPLVEIDPTLCQSVYCMKPFWFLAHLSTKCSRWAIVIDICPSSVICLSVSQSECKYGHLLVRH